MTRMFRLIALALVAAAVFAPTAISATEPAASCSQAGNAPGCYNGKPVDPLATAYLASKGLTPAEIKQWTVGICAQGVEKPAACFAAFEQTPAPAATVTSTGGFYNGKPIDPLATAYLASKGLTPEQIKDWTVGICAQGAEKPAVCFAPFEQTSAPAATVTSSDGFEWSDASIGAAAMLGVVLLLAGLGAILATSRHSRRRTVASA